jgi:hypothetical protein
VTHDPGSGKGAPSGAPTRRRHSTTHAAVEALVRFSEEERVWAAAQAHIVMDRLLAEHAAALEEIRDVLRQVFDEGLPALPSETVDRAMARLDEEIIHVRRIGGIDQEDETDRDD